MSYIDSFIILNIIAAQSEKSQIRGTKYMFKL